MPSSSSYLTISFESLGLTPARITPSHDLPGPLECVRFSLLLQGNQETVMWWIIRTICQEKGEPSPPASGRLTQAGWGGTCPLKVPCAQLCSLRPWTVPLIAGFLHEPSSYFCQNSFHPEMLAQKHSGPRTRRLRLMCAFVMPATEWKVSLVIIKVQEGFLHDMTPHPQSPY